MRQTAIELQRKIIQLRFSTDEDCSICYQNMCGKPVMYWPCGHTFHLSCMRAFKNKCITKHLCPCCRFEYITEKERDARLLDNYWLEILHALENPFWKSQREKLFSEISENIWHPNSRWDLSSSPPHTGLTVRWYSLYCFQAAALSELLSIWFSTIGTFEKWFFFPPKICKKRRFFCH